MAKRSKVEAIVAKLRQADVLTLRRGILQSRSVVEAIRAIGVREITSYRRRHEFAGLRSDQGRR